MNTIIEFGNYLVTVALIKANTSIYIKMIDTKALILYECNMEREDITLLMDINTINLFYIIENSFNKSQGFEVEVSMNNEIITLLFIGEFLHNKYNFEISIKKTIVSYPLYPLFYIQIEINNYQNRQIYKQLCRIRAQLIAGNEHEDNDGCKYIRDYCSSLYNKNNTKKIKIE